MKRRTGRIILIATIVILAGGGAFEPWIRHTYGTFTPWLTLPAKLNVFGRDYRNPGAPASRADVESKYGPGCLDLLQPPPFWVPFLLPSHPCGRQDVVPTIVWLQVGPDAFRAYSLSGGP